jgi:hypothetical protein
MEEPLTPLQSANISHVLSKFSNSDKIVNYDVDLSKWKIKHLYKDTLWVQLLDEPDSDSVLRNGIHVPVSQVKALYRLGKVIMCGSETKYAKEGEVVRFPQGVGQPYEQKVGGFKTWLLREDSVMAVVEFEGSEEQLQDHLVNDIHLAGK